MMQGENCIEVRNVFNLSLPYLTRFFGSAGPILRIDKDENSKEVLIRFANRFSVDKALRFEGRILDKEPIRIRLNRPKPTQQPDNALTATSGTNPRRKDHLTNFRQTLGGTGRFREDLWGIVFGEVRRCELEESAKVAVGLLMWRMATVLMAAARHLQRHHLNARSNYLQFQLERELWSRLDRKQGVAAGMADGRAGVEVREGRAWLWYSVPFANSEEEESKAEGYSSMSQCLQRVEHTSAIVAHILRGLYACAAVFAPEEAAVETLIGLEWEAEGSGSREESFMGMMESIGCRDLFYELLGYEQPNSCLSLGEEADRPDSFECSLRLVGCQNVPLEERSWCDFYEAVAWKRWTSPTEYYFHIEIKGPAEQPTLADHSLFFEEAHFSCEAACAQYRKYIHLGLAPHPRLYYLRKQRTHSEQAFEQLYEDEVINIYDQVRRDQPLQQMQEGAEEEQEGVEEEAQEVVEPLEPGQEGAEDAGFHEEVVVNLWLVQVRSAGQSALNQLKLEHYLLEYIEESIVGKQLIIASQEMAFKLAANIIEREKEGRLYEFAHPRFEKHIGEELWRLYSRLNERKLRSTLLHYQLARR